MSSLFTSDDIEKILSTTLIGKDKGAIDFVALDSRNVKQGTLFIPLVGEVQDGNIYIESALKNGARYSLVTEVYYNNNRDVISLLLEKYNVGLFVVENTLLALHKLAKNHIEKFPKLKKIVITGSSGKTSTKEILGSILRKEGSVLVTKGNYNSETGLPLTVFRINETHEFALLEMGMSKPGEIEALVNIVAPDIGIITNIGRAHIGFFSGIDGIAREKKNLFSRFKKDSIGIVPRWDEFSEYLSKNVNGTVYSVSKKPDYIGNVEDLGFNGWRFSYEGNSILFPYIGEYNFLNAQLAIFCGRVLGVSCKSIVEGLEGVEFLFGRGEILQGRNKIIRDCYNANPDSMKSALDMFKNTDYSGEKIPVLGSMYELGDRSESAHRELLEYATAIFPKVLFYGDEFFKIKEGFKTGLGACFYATLDNLIDGVKREIPDGSLVLLKASRGVKLEEITESIL